MNAYHKSSIPVGILFPEIFEDILCSLLTHIPFLQMPCMHEFLVARAEFLTLWIVGVPNERGWEFLQKIKEGRDVNMSVSFPDPYTIAEDHMRRQMNYVFIDKLIEDYATSIVPRKTKLLTRK
ncbi:MAG: hypothetical protein A2937_02595 [Candidatus Yonathbacteria bacterium RIFCSPLOWO2_01_FULL_47_33b]|uniref:Uncharacterized protein n=1 Tax=Candidatus Yonathbacteria bacterium RIFCSPLOWO2_01_FULL_47_33b TaxID=1802727 RepID=A0A1G2SHD8_9BACT|nr:MAG: hypothetical protein A2937_02595 [Candidatus Yonathbacteria bacterium RIFCSPLOWO2_01_FULL_47_33b]